jgi:hypothetical protein
MKTKHRFDLTLAAIGILMTVLVALAMALTPVRKEITLTDGAGTWENTENYKVYKLKIVRFSGGEPEAVTPNVSHVAGDVTTEIGSVTLSSGAGSIVDTNTTYIFKGDLISIGGELTNDAEVQLILEAYPD